MPKQRLREVLTTSLTAEYLSRRAAEGWTPIAVEWQRETAEPAPRDSDLFEEIPYGLQVSGDCLHLEENPTEKKVLLLIMERIIQDEPLSRISDELNLNGHRTRLGAKWSPVAVFNLLPRLVEVGPRIFSSNEWVERRERLLRAM